MWQKMKVPFKPSRWISQICIECFEEEEERGGGRKVGLEEEIETGVEDWGRD
jgi:hypothetical protein